MAGLLVRLVITAISVVVAAYVLPDQYLRVDGLESVLLFAVVLGILNALVRPVLLFFTLPLTLLTLGLFTLVINAIVFWLATLFLQGVEVGGFLGAFLAALVVSIVSFILSRLIP